MFSKGVPRASETETGSYHFEGPTQWVWLGASLFVGDVSGARVRIIERSSGAADKLGMPATMLSTTLLLCCTRHGVALLAPISESTAAHTEPLPVGASLFAHAESTPLRLLKFLSHESLVSYRDDGWQVAAERVAAKAVEKRRAAEAASSLVKFTIANVSSATIAMRTAPEFPGVKTEFAVRPGQAVCASQRITKIVDGIDVNFFHVVPPSGVGFSGWVFDAMKDHYGASVPLFKELHLVFRNISGVALGLRAVSFFNFKMILHD